MRHLIVTSICETFNYYLTDCKLISFPKYWLVDGTIYWMKYSLISWFQKPSDVHHLKNSNGGCLGVKNESMYHTSHCTNDLSLRWILIRNTHILNLKSVMCLQWSDALKEFTAAQCKLSVWKQKWSSGENGTILLHHKNFGTIKPLYSTLSTKRKTSKYYGKCFCFVQPFRGWNININFQIKNFLHRFSPLIQHAYWKFFRKQTYKTGIKCILVFKAI